MRYNTIGKGLDYIATQYKAVRSELDSPHGARVANGLRDGAATGIVGGAAAGLLAYGIARYFGADTRTAMEAASYWGRIGAGAGFAGNYVRHAGDRAGMESLRNMARPAFDFMQSYKFA